MDELRIMVDRERESRMVVAGVGEILSKNIKNGTSVHRLQPSGSRWNDARAPHSRSRER